MKFQRILDNRAEVVTTDLINFQMQLILENKRYFKKYNHKIEIST